MKKVIFLLFTAISMVTAVTAQTRTVFTGPVIQGEFIDFGGYNFVPSDSLQVSDSIAYVIPITHTNSITAYQTFRWKKIGAGTATLTVNFLQGNGDGTYYFPVVKGVNQTAYTKSYTLSTDSTFNINFAADTAFITGRTLKIQFITSATASVKGKIANRLKTNIK